jgi:hypothetical protein
MLPHVARIAETRTVFADAVAAAFVVLAARRGDIFTVLAMKSGLTVAELVLQVYPDTRASA